MKPGVLPGWRPLFVIAVISAAVAGISPKDSPVIAAVSGVSTAILAALWLVRQRIRTDLSMIGFLVLLAAMVIALPWSIMHGISPRDYFLRGVAPLIFLGFGFLLPLSSRQDCEFVLKTILAACAIWAIEIAATLAASFDQTVLQRWTTISENLLFPFNLAAISILLFHDRILSPVTRGLGIAVFLLLTIGGGYRVQLFIVALLLLAYFVLSLSRSRIGIPMVILVSLAVILGWYLPTSGGEELIGRLLALGAERESARVMEIKFAFSSFLESPIIGQGLPNPVPVEVTFFGREAYLTGIQGQIADYSHVALVHNFVMYTAMNLGVVGLVGLALYFGGILVPLESTGRYLLTGVGRTAALAACLSMFAHTLVAATFTLYPFNLMISCLVAVLAARVAAVDAVEQDGARELRESNERSHDAAFIGMGANQ